MNNVDHIIRYLSDEMNPEEASSFKEKLVADQGFREEFEEVSAAYNLIRDQLQKRDMEYFKQSLSEVMKRSEIKAGHSRRNQHSWWYLPLLLAGCLAILLSIFLSKPDGDKIYSRYYHPEDDPVLTAFNQGTRGITESGILYYTLGQYSKTIEVMSEQLTQNPDNQLAQLYYLLASIETGMQDSALVRLAPLEPDIDHQLGQAICWYRTLALIKSGRIEEVEATLLPLIQRAGPYQSDARRIRKNLLK